ncbi:MAG: hypothetical protein AAB618_02095 [Patescibacteria group bacterium]
MSAVESLYRSILDTMVGSHPADAVLDDTAFIIFPGGGGQDWRLYQAPWEFYARRIICAGTRDDPKYNFDEVAQFLKRDTAEPVEVRFQGYAAHSKAQTDWLTMELQASPYIKRLILSTARYHLPRCALTFIKSWLAAGNSPLPLLLVPTDGERGNDDATSQTAEEELERIVLYQEKGDVATAEEYERFVGRFR